MRRKGLIAIEGAPYAGSAGWTPEEAALTLVANRPLIAHAVDTVRRAGAEEVVIAAAASSVAAVRDALGEADVRWVETAAAPTAAEAIRAAAGALAGERFVLHVAEGMLVRDRGTLRTALAEATADATVFFQADEAGEKIAGVHVFGPAVVDAVKDVAERSPLPVRLSEVVELLAENGGHVQGGALEGWWTHQASAEALLDLNHRVLDEICSHVEAKDLTGARIEGRVRLHPTATVRNSVVRGPVVIGAHARVTDAFVGPYSTIGDGATIENAEIASSIVLPRARIRHVGVRVEDSIVGAGATIGRDFALPKSIKLLVGSGAKVTLG